MIELAATFDQQFATIPPVFLYLLVGAIIFAETAFVLGFFLPGSSILFSAGLVAAAHGEVNIAFLVVIIFLACFFGNQIGFVLGRTVGRPFLDKYQGKKMQGMIERSERFYKRNGWWAVVAARFIPWVRTFVPPIAGASMMNYYKFLSANVLGALLWGVGITLTGFYAASLPWVQTWTYGIAAFFILGSITSALVDYLRHRPRRQRTS